MRELIPRQMFEVAIQASIGAKIISRETVHAIRKNVIAKCYGGRYFPQAQAAGETERRQKRMKRIGRVDIHKRHSGCPEGWRRQQLREYPLARNSHLQHREKRLLP